MESNTWLVAGVEAAAAAAVVVVVVAVAAVAVAVVAAVRVVAMLPSVTKQTAHHQVKSQRTFHSNSNQIRVNLLLIID